MNKIKKHSDKFYIQQVNAEGLGLIPNTKKDLEQDFGSLLYKSLTNTVQYGKKRRYTEEFAEDNRVRVYTPLNASYNTTSLELSLYFVGEKRTSEILTFNDYINTGVMKYWDTARGIEFYFYCDNITISDEKMYGNLPYIEAKYTLINIKGKTERI